MSSKQKIEKLSKDIDCLSKEIEDIKKHQVKLLELKNELTQIKTQGMSSIVEWKDRERIHDLDKKRIKIAPSE